MSDTPWATPKILGIGLSRTGTTSLAEALNLLFIRSRHVELPDEIFHYDGCTDTPVTVRYKELDLCFPNSRFILTVRPVEAWLRSVEKHWARTPLELVRIPILRFEYMMIRLKLYGSLNFDKEMYRAAYQRHVEDVKSYFTNRPNDLLIMNVEEGWKPLCDFLGKPEPSMPFPWLNKSPDG